MRRITALLAIATLLLVGGMSTAQAAERDKSSRTSSSQPTRTVTLQRIFGQGFARALKLIQAFDSVTPIGAAPNTIIDEPDPAGKEDGTGKDDRKDNEKTDQEILEDETIESTRQQQKLG